MTAAVAPALVASSTSAATSSSWSVGKRLTATTTGAPKRAMLRTCRARLVLAPLRAAAASLSLTSSGGGRVGLGPKAPPCSFIARTVHAITTQSGRQPLARALMLKNFSAPMSEPKPASVTTKSAAPSATRSATTLEFPCAMLAKGPQCTSAGSPSYVCTRLGSSASRSSSAMTPSALRSEAVTGVPSVRCATTTRASRALRSA
mmetsp:Transcript_2623/g.7805  ORF Transcript_2623/g.7805 Transcript_2623/m.7805 type:complete len:204 (+) Transcript_2623:536-1147(+)